MTTQQVKLDRSGIIRDSVITAPSILTKSNKWSCSHCKAVIEHAISVYPIRIGYYRLTKVVTEKYEYQPVTRDLIRVESFYYLSIPVISSANGCATCHAMLSVQPTRRFIEGCMRECERFLLVDTPPSTPSVQGTSPTASAKYAGATRADGTRILGCFRRVADDE